MTETQPAIDLIKKQLDQLDAYQSKTMEFDGWHRDTRILLEKLFKKDSDHVNEFQKIKVQIRYSVHPLGSNPIKCRFAEAKAEFQVLLNSIIREVEQFGLENTTVAATPSSKLENLFERFHAAACQLRQRHAGRETLDISDEYDVQDLIHALLKLHFDDIRPEECTPSYAGKASRTDFLLKDEQIFIEVKKTRKGLTQKEVGEQLIIDIARYQSHPYCKTLICFVYDPRWVDKESKRSRKRPLQRI